MADAIDFPGSNFTFKAPPGCDDVRDLHTFRQHDGPCNVSCWQLRPDELDDVIRSGGKVFMSNMSGLTFYPAFVGSERVVRSVVVDYGKVWDRGDDAPAPAADGLPRAIFAANFPADEDPAVIEAKWQEWSESRRQARVQAAEARSYMLSPAGLDRAVAAMTPLVSDDMDETMRRAWLLDLAFAAIAGAMQDGAQT